MNLSKYSSFVLLALLGLFSLLPIEADENYFDKTIDWTEKKWKEGNELVKDDKKHLSSKRSKKLLDETLVHNTGSFPLTHMRRLSTTGNDDDDPEECSVNQSLFHLQLSPDYYPSDTSWELQEILNGTTVLNGGDLQEINTLYEVRKCIDSNICYQFIIKDSYGDGLLYPGFYKVEFDKQRIQEGGADIGFSETSFPFGHGCPSFQPSVSDAPTISPRPSSSLKPTSKPSVSAQPSSSPSSGCDTSESLFRVQVKTDLFPSETSWKLIHTINGTKTTVINENKFEALYNTLHTFRKCLESNLCYQFTIYDSYGNGLSDYVEGKVEQGWYKMKFDGLIIQEGEGNFGFNETSMFFGNGCQSLPTSFPSTSKPPSNKPSISPSSSVKPSLPLTQSSVPSQSFIPTSFPSELKDIISYSHDNLNRRFFPPPLLRKRPEDSNSHHIWPNCSSSEIGHRVIGCVEIPSTSNRQSSPSWAGTLHSGKPPTCERKRCDLQVPMSNKALKVNVTSKILDGTNFRLKRRNILPHATFNDASSSRVILTADVNLDGWPDIIIGNYGQPNQLFMSKEGGVYEEVVGDFFMNEDSFTNSIAVGDVNSDGFPDLVVVNFGQNNKLLLNQGDGTFQEAVDAIPGNSNTPTTAVALGDFDEDGLLDLVIGNRGQPNELFLNTGNGIFRSSIAGSIPALDTLTQSVTVADVNADGLVDIIFGNELHPNQLLLNKGDGFFEEVKGALPDESFHTNVIIVADVDGDEDIDLIIGNYGAEEPNQLFLNQGDGSFKATPGSFPSDHTLKTQSIAVADLDGDGLLDVLIGTDLGQHNQMLLNQGEGSFQAVTVGAIPGLPTSTYGNEQENQPSTLSIAVADLDADGRVDVLIGNHDNPNQVLYNRERFGYLEVPNSFVKESNTRNIAVADLDGDGLPDLFFGNYAEPNQILLNQGDLTFQEMFSDVSVDDTLTEAIAVGDLNGDGLPDLVIGNYGQNQLLFNKGGGHFEESYLAIPNDEKQTEALALADINADGYLDILVCNLHGPNQLFLNEGDGTFQELVDAITGDYRTYEIAVADFNNDGFIDIVIGNYKDPNQLLLNQGDGTFQEIEGALPGEHETYSIAVADVNADGLIDIIVGNIGSYPNQLLLNRGNDEFEEIYGALPNSDSKKIVVIDVDGDSFPDLFIGNFLEPIKLLINQGDGTFEELEGAIPRGEQFLTAAFGDFNADGRIDFVIGNYLAQNRVLLFSECPNGGAPLHGSSWCFPCPAIMGRPQIQNFELSVCQECAPDHIQDESTGRCSAEPCFLQMRKLGRDVCQDCPNGYFYDSTILRSEDIPSFLQERCAPCDQGTYHSKELHGRAIDQCSPCIPGTYTNNTGSNQCEECEPGTYAPLFGQSSCRSCPTRLSSPSNSATCSYCSEGYILNHAFDEGLLEASPRLNQSYFTYFSNGSTYQNEGQSKLHYSTNYSFFTSFNGEEFIFEREPYDESCLPCPQNADCNFNTTIQTLGVSPNYWRDSQETSTLYFCGGDERCSGNLDDTTVTNYCKDGYHGPLCKLCDDDDKYYFSERKGECLKCPSSSLISFRASVTIMSAIVVIMVIRFIKRWSKIQNVLRIRGLQTKIKILVSFYQVAATFQGIYDIKLDKSVAKILDFLSQLTFGFFDLIPIPADCIGSKKEQLLFILLSPIAFLLLVGITLKFIQTSLSRYNMADGNTSEERNTGVNGPTRLFTLLSPFDWKMRCINIIIITFYIVLPGISNNIFSIVRCQHFITSDETDQYRSYLMDDLSIQCDRNEPEYFVLLAIFWVSVVLWLCLIFALWAVLLIKIWHPVRTSHITPLANACRFLWVDYKPSMMVWDIFDMIRKILLTGVITCIDMKSSTKILRLIIAGTISLIYVVFLAMSRPYKRAEDQYLAIISNVMLICCFSMGTILNLCDDDICENVIGLGSYTASVIVIVLTLGTLVLTFIIVTTVMLFTIKHPTLRLKSGAKPNLILDDVGSGYKYHAFFSHCWKTGQYKSHAIVRRIQLAMPDVRIWLDVDNIQQANGQLEKAVEKSVVLMLFYSKGYFASENCRREIYTAIRLGKPVIIIYEGNETELENMRKECERYCSDDDIRLSKILMHLEENPIPWVNEDIFAAKALNNICVMLLTCLPYYQRHPCELRDGVRVPGELGGQVKLTSPVTILGCRANGGSLKIVSEAKKLLGEIDANLLSIIEPIDDVEELEGLVCPGRGRNSDLILNRDVSKIETKYVLILYLNNDIFEHDSEELTILLRRAMDLNIEIILLHELALQLGGCEFDDFFLKTPRGLLEEPYKIYCRSVAVPLHNYSAYRELGLKRLLYRLGAEEVVNKKMSHRISEMLHASLEN